MSTDLVQKATTDIAAVQNAEKVVLFVSPWCFPEDGMSLRSTICAPSELSLGADGVGCDAIMVGSEPKATLTCFGDQTDSYAIMPVERLVGDDLEAALASIRTVLAAISVENDGRCGYVWDLFDNREVPTDAIVIGDTIVLPHTTHRASDLLHVCPFLMAEDEDREESSVEMYFADGRVARLRGGMDWYNAMC